MLLATSHASSHHILRTTAVAVALAVAGGAVGASVAAGQAPAVLKAATAPKLSDADVAQVVVTANAIDVRHGELALRRTKNAAVKEFAEQMVRDHNAVNKAAGDLVARLGVTPTASDVSRALERDGAKAEARLGALRGAEFDRAYIADEVAYHEAVIRAIDSVLVPSSQNAELKQTLINVRPNFVAHLAHARAVQQKLGSH